MLSLPKVSQYFKPSRILSKYKLPAVPAMPSAGVLSQSSTRRAQEAINVIPLFGSRRLISDIDGRSWVLVCASENPERLTDRESMFINAALTAARGQ